MNQTKTALCIWKRLTGGAGDAAAHPAIDEPAERRHWSGITHAIADEQAGAGLFGGTEKGGKIGGRMLTVTIEQGGPTEAALVGRDKAGVNGGAFAAIAGVFDD